MKSPAPIEILAEISKGKMMKVTAEEIADIKKFDIDDRVRSAPDKIGWVIWMEYNDVQEFKV